MISEPKTDKELSDLLSEIETGLAVKLKIFMTEEELRALPSVKHIGPYKEDESKIFATYWLIRAEDGIVIGYKNKSGEPEGKYTFHFAYGLLAKGP